MLFMLLLEYFLKNSDSNLPCLFSEYDSKFKKEVNLHEFGG